MVRNKNPSLIRLIANLKNKSKLRTVVASYYDINRGLFMRRAIFQKSDRFYDDLKRDADKK